jgi:predicted ATP-grasp superfamily ATP-dependent carboligase
MIDAKLVTCVRKINEVNMEGGIIIDEFPSAGLVNAIASGCIIRSNRTKVAAVYVSPDFPTLSIISDSLPQFLARIYVNEDSNSLFRDRIDIDKTMYREVATTMIQWALEHHCKLIISGAGIPTDKKKEHKSTGEEIDLCAVSHRIWSLYYKKIWIVTSEKWYDFWNSSDPSK